MYFAARCPFALGPAVMMPRGSADVRGEQLAALETEYHALLTTPKVSRLLERAEARSPSMAAREPEGDAPSARPRHRRSAALIARLAKASASAEVFWVEARKPTLR